MHYCLNLTTIFLITKSNRILNKTSLLYWSERKFLFATKGEHIISVSQIVKPTTQGKKRSKKDIAIIENIFDKYIQKAYEEKIFCEENKSTSYAYSFDNLYFYICQNVKCFLIRN